MNLREWKSSLTEVNKVFKEDGMKRSQRKVLRLIRIQPKTRQQHELRASKTWN